jgi:transcriptional regulator with XRE-family HTH domain
MKVGQRIKLRREEIGLSVDELAEMLGKNRATIYRYESNEIEKLPTTVLEPLAKALHTTPAYLMGWEIEEKPVPTEDENELLKVVKELNTEYQFTDSQISRIASYMRFVGNEDSSEE